MTSSENKCAIRPMPTPLSAVLLVGEEIGSKNGDRGLVLFVQKGTVSKTPDVGKAGRFPGPPVVVNVAVGGVVAGT